MRRKVTAGDYLSCLRLLRCFWSGWLACAILLQILCADDLSIDADT